MTLDKRIEDRLERIRNPHDFPPYRKVLLLIHPCYDRFTRDSHAWAEKVKDKAIEEGWDVEDLSGVNASRVNIETILTRIPLSRPILVIHYDHGSEFSLYGQSPGPEELVNVDATPPVIDERNIHMTRGMFVSAAACLSAVGLGPLAIAQHARGYLGYSSLVSGSFNFAEEFGEAMNAPNYALLEGKSPEEAFEIGYNAWDQLYTDLMDRSRSSDVSEAGAFFMAWEAGAARWNRDYIALLLP